MKKLRDSRLWNVLFLLLLFVTDVRGATVIVSFLADQNGLSNTLSFLRAADCNQEGLLAFRKAVELYNSKPTKLDLSKFPRMQGGVYKFDSFPSLFMVMPHLCQAEHDEEVNCLDSVILLAAGKLRTGLAVDEISGPFLMEHRDNVGRVNIDFAATARDACALIYPNWYFDSGNIPKSMADERTCLTATLFGAFVLPNATSLERLEKTLFSTLNMRWGRSGIQFPKDCEIVLCHVSNLKSYLGATKHAGVLFRREGRLVYIEKAGIKGPFCRFDFENPEDLNSYLETHMAFHLQGSESPESTYCFATFNDNSIKRLFAERLLERVKVSERRH